MSKKGIRTVPLAIIAMLVVAGGVAWACTPQPRLSTVSPPSGPVGLEIIVKGQAVPPGNPIEVRLGGLAQPLGSTEADSSGRFSMVATIPKLEPGIYYVVVDAKSFGITRDSFEVTAEAPVGDAPIVDQSAAPIPAAQTADLWRGFESVGSPVDITGPSAQDPQPAGALAAAGAGLVAAGAATALGAAGLVAVRRRRRASP